MSRTLQILPWVLVLAPFLVLAYFYDSLTSEVVTFRSLSGDEINLAPKSIFTVFRVPLIEVVCAAAIEIMRRRASGRGSESDSDYYLFWTILLFTVGLKSVLQTIETIGPARYSNHIFCLTLGTVIAGILTAAIAGRKLPRRIGRLKGRISGWESVGLFLLLIAYIVLAFVSV
jgi:hypothetical protein